MEQKKVVRKILEETVILVFSCVVIIFFSTTITAFDSKSIMNQKDIVYEIYNEGVESCKYHYDSITIESPNAEDKRIVFNEGLKNVKYSSLMKLELSNDYGKTEFNKNEFKKYVDYNPFKYLKITVDKEHIDDITYYEHMVCINNKEFIKYTLIIFFAINVFFYYFKMKKEINENNE